MRSIKINRPYRSAKFSKNLQAAEFAGILLLPLGKNKIGIPPNNRQRANKGAARTHRRLFGQTDGRVRPILRKNNQRNGLKTDNFHHLPTPYPLAKWWEIW